MKKFRVKPDYVSAFIKIIDNPFLGFTLEFFEGREIHRILVSYNILDLFCEELPPQIEEWKDPLFRSDMQMQITDKAELLIRMQSWADYHNKIDGFTPSWDAPDYQNHGIIVENWSARCSYNHFANIFLFQITVNSKERAEQMLKYFHKDIQSLIDKGLI